MTVCLRSFVRSFVPSFVPSFVGSFVRWFVRSFDASALQRFVVVRSFVPSFDSFVPWSLFVVSSPHSRSRSVFFLDCGVAWSSRLVSPRLARSYRLCLQLLQGPEPSLYESNHWIEYVALMLHAEANDRGAVKKMPRHEREVVKRLPFQCIPRHRQTCESGVDRQILPQLDCWKRNSFAVKRTTRRQQLRCVHSIGHVSYLCAPDSRHLQPKVNCLLGVHNSSRVFYRYLLAGTFTTRRPTILYLYLPSPNEIFVPICCFLFCHKRHPYH